MEVGGTKRIAPNSVVLARPKVVLEKEVYCRIHPRPLGDVSRLFVAPSLLETLHLKLLLRFIRTTLARYFLSIPAMFFWGVGTSSIGQNSFKWGETAAAAALAVASIVIPAIDSFFSGPGVQILWGIVSTSGLGYW